MPSLIADFTDEEIETLEQLRVQWHLSDLEETATFVAKRALRLGMQKMTGQGRSMTLVSPEDFTKDTE